MDSEDDVLIHLAEIKTFGRWANSTNFQTKRCKEKGLYYALFRPQYNWAIKVIKSGLFDFSSYFDSLELPWIEYERWK